jgi:hypothetical protein
MRWHKKGTDLSIWCEAVNDSSYIEYKSTVAEMTANGSTNGGDPFALEGVTVTWNSTFDMFKVVIPTGQLPADGNWFNAVIDWAGIIDVKMEAFITDILTLADVKTQAAAALTDFNTESPLAKTSDVTGLNNLSAQQVWEYVTRTLTAIPTGTATSEALGTAQGDLTLIKAALDNLNDISIDGIFDEAIDPSSHTTPGSFGRLFYVLYCALVGRIINTQTTRGILDENGNQIVANTLTATTDTVIRNGGHEV